MTRKPLWGNAGYDIGTALLKPNDCIVVVATGAPLSVTFTKAGCRNAEAGLDAVVCDFDEPRFDA